jgi:pantothenate kinase
MLMSLERYLERHLERREKKHEKKARADKRAQKNSVSTPDKCAGDHASSEAGLLE